MPPQSAKDAEKATAPRKGEVLLIEDDNFIGVMYTRKLENAGFVVRWAMDGEEGWQELRKQCPDLVLLDIVLPKRDGFVILEEMRKDEKLRHIPVIILSNLGQKTDVERGLSLGADDYVVKAHFTPAEVVERVARLLQTRKGGAGGT
jgi:DNA-binding response OmpR family regulator